MATSLLYFNISDIHIMTAQHFLSEAGIESYKIDKKDSVYAGILGGKIELYVSEEDHQKAYEILKENELVE